jgi:hypothetical protein
MLLKGCGKQVWLRAKPINSQLHLTLHGRGNSFGNSYFPITGDPV